PQAPAAAPPAVGPGPGAPARRGGPPPAAIPFRPAGRGALADRVAVRPGACAAVLVARDAALLPPDRKRRPGEDAHSELPVAALRRRGRGASPRRADHREHGRRDRGDPRRDRARAARGDEQLTTLKLPLRLAH